ncbi:GNAT family N-acetyltransferase [Paroceanicella profunda]|uniref:GNAT family N-acetyltransferase n=1 Tax=Paroceanicella profunda TaxID=2579971 RepID=A0A5B8FWS7_9RHOB|nr:GNAT family N-acetyltransferase [Paroceanicella profunda]QDL91630.1 GNAT family N-acetyltransferase [Paroceanicella profunda]
MTQAPQFRQAGPADADTLRAIAEAAFALYVPRIGRRPAPMDADFAADAADTLLLLAPDPCGYLTLRRAPGEMVVETVALHPAWQGRGLGKLLMARAEAEARAAGLGTLSLYTNAAMTENLAFYPRLGFRRTGQRTEDGFDRVFFARDL